MKLAGKIREAKKPLSKKKRKLCLIIAAAAVLVLAACYTVFIAPLLEKEQWIYKEEQVKRGTLKVGVTESGSLEYGITSVFYELDLDVSEEDDEDEEESGENVQKYLKIEEVCVKAGERITEGELLFRFTQDSVEDVRTLLKSAAAEAESEYAEAQSEYSLSLLQAKADYESRMLEEQYASAIYGYAAQAVKNEAAAIQVEINQRTANIASLEEALAEAEEDYQEIWEDFQEAQKPSIEENSTVNFMLMQKEYLNLQEKYENAKSALSRAKQALEDNAAELASLQLQLTSAQSRSETERLEAEETYQESLINGKNAQINYNAQLETLEETLLEAEQERDSVLEKLEAFEAFVGEDGCLYADGEGIVTSVGYEAGDRLREKGVMLSYAAPDEMTLSVDVTQEDIVDLQVGDKVDITFLAYGDVSYEGSIQSIHTTATSSSSNTVSYTVVIAVEGDTTSLYGGMTADIVFVKEQREDTLYISKKAIVEEEGKTYVYQKNLLGGMELKEVETGIDNGVSIEILSGLEEGETIYLASRVSSENAVMSGNGETGAEAASGAAGFGEMPDGADFGGIPDGADFEAGFGGMPGGADFEGEAGGMNFGGAPGGGRR